MDQIDSCSRKSMYELRCSARSYFKGLTARLFQRLLKSGCKYGDTSSILEDFSRTKIDLQNFLDIDNNAFWDMYKSWPSIEESMFYAENNTFDFYKAWEGGAGMANLCANVVNQFLDDSMYFLLKKYIHSAPRILDYGCGTASITLSHLINSNNSYRDVFLFELQQLVKEFISFRCKKYELSGVVSGDLENLELQDPFDLVICIDVLEHLETPSSIFVESILPKVKIGGLLILKAPWRGQLTHIDAAPNDFYRAGGRRALQYQCREVERINCLDVAAVYERIR